ncbi:hypothetical protein HPP92_000733 [Vanilla planifolia]|uniref:BHLH domain-containing protein n=1 Tax=Vanilla planifolia TaxID=51239 RepID=A0A835VEP3_VANPL|nr:hypothetical protein HPP92_000733 [Vanilla planifolia]
METSTSLNQLFKNLCHRTIWKYAMLWKFQHQTHMVLTCQEAYATDLKSAECSLEMVVSNMTRYSYLHGEGIIGKVASLLKHAWICIGEDSNLFLEYPEEFRLQVSAGIKTVLFLPVFPLGVVQLGSVDQLSEDLTLVAELEDLFFDYQSNSDFHSIFDMRMSQTLLMSLTMSKLQKHSPSFPINSELTDPACFQSQDALHLAHGLGSELVLDELNWNSLCSEVFQDQSEDIFLDLTMLTRNFGSNQSILSCHEQEGPFIFQGSNYETPLVYDPFRQDFPQHCINICPLNKADPESGENHDLPMAPRKDDRSLDLPIETVFNKAIKHKFFDNCGLIENQSKENQGNESISTFRGEIPGPIECSRAFIKENRLGYLASDAKEALHCNFVDDEEMDSCKGDKSCCSSERCTESCLTHYKTKVLLSEDSVLQSQKKPFLILDAKGFMSYNANSSSRCSVSVQSTDRDHDMVWKRCSKISHHRSRLTKNRELRRPRPRPRDRQLIQDRIKELRELVPNTSKCSIDALLERTVKHMMFLQSVPQLADKLSKSANRKASWDNVFETKSKAFPLNIENLDRPDQMLVEMQCRNHMLFLKIAQVIKRLGLHILNGVLEKQAEELWAHFIVEVPKGFHRMDVVWPLMQLLQLRL